MLGPSYQDGKDKKRALGFPCLSFGLVGILPGLDLDLIRIGKGNDFTVHDAAWELNTQTSRDEGQCCQKWSCKV